jgi:hypothetical protein
MPALSGIHVFLAGSARKTWMAGIRLDKLGHDSG